MSTESSRQLKRSAMGAPGIVFFVVAAAAPLGATLGAGPVAFAATGPGVPGLYLVASVVLLLFAVGYAAMSRHVTDAGGFTAYIALGLGRRAGHASAGVALLAYNCLLLGVAGQFGVFAQDLSRGWGHEVPWQLAAAAALLLVGVLGYLEIDLSAKVLGVLLVAEVLVLLVFDVAVIARGGADGLDAAGFAPGNLLAGAPGIALLFAFTCFIGFEATTVYGEEAREPRRTVPRATYVAVLVMGGFYTLTTWAIGLAHPAEEIAARAGEDPVGFVTALNTAFVGTFSTELMQVLVVTSVFAVLLALHNTLSRYLFSLGRGGLLPEFLGRTHPRHRSPHRASAAQSGITALALAVFLAAGADPFGQLYPWMMGIGTVAVLVLQTAVAAAVLVFFRRRVRGPRWQTAVAPLLGMLGLAAGIVLAVANFDVLTGLTGGAAFLLPWLIPVAALLTLVAAEVSTRRGHPVHLGATALSERDGPAPDRTPAAR
ncbi:APC family permease [Saccharopolyspora sp. MS10]|uniref:APC family permease n=1 Tax=Saccharopolyspora sp. MS10 TaxID=3385973 RepID=UPI0039A0CE81